MTRHDTFIVPVLDRWLLFAPLHRTVALINTAAARTLRDGAATQAARVLAAAGEGLTRPPASTPVPPRGAVCPSMLGIMPTRGCNLGCTYCDFGGPGAAARTMPLRVAVGAVDWAVRSVRAASRQSFRLHFFGGEPFEAPDVVSAVVHRARWLAEREGVAPYVDASTNGVIDDAFCEFVGDYFDGIAVSLDGPADIHDRQRPDRRGRPTFDRVNRTASRLSRMPVDLCLRVCVTDRSVGDLEAIVRWMMQTYQPAAVNLETLTTGARAKRSGLAAPDPYDFARHCVGAYAVGEALGIRVAYSAAEAEQARLSFCPLGTDAFVVAPDGRVSGCYLRPRDWRRRGLDLDVGRVDADGTVALDPAGIERLRRLPLDKTRCERCFCQWTCAGGCHVNQTYPGCGEEYSPFCLQTRLVTACLLLRDLGADDLVAALLADRPAMARLAGHPRDEVDIERMPPGAYACRPAPLEAERETVMEPS